MNIIRWGIIGCGDVAEKKSGPAFQKVKNSELLAVMRRNSAKARDFAYRHKVPMWYSDETELLANQEINAVYIATPPSTHKEYALKALEAGKDVYLEKPMSMSVKESAGICEAVKRTGRKLVVAHYRRKMPVYQKVLELLEQKWIGDVQLAELRLFQPTKTNIVANSEENWRMIPEISGGGLFHDLAPHQIDLLYYFFGDIRGASGFSGNRSGKYRADDLVTGSLIFQNGVQFSGSWSFGVSEKAKVDEFSIYGNKGFIRFSCFGTELVLDSEGRQEKFEFPNLPHVQQPMISSVVDYFLGNSPNPCSAEEGKIVMEVMEKFCRQI